MDDQMEPKRRGMDSHMQAKLREKFPNEKIGKKPKLTCRACRDARFKACNEHPAQWCEDCGQKISPRHMHIEFVGHANVTDRLLDVDPEWDWEPLAFDQDGLPKFDTHGGLWIRLTVGGKSRIGYGGSDGKQGEDAVKEVIGDAIKNAAMRFGVALDLWRKEEPSGKDEAPQQRPRQARPAPAPAATPAAADTVGQARADLAAFAQEKGLHLSVVEAEYVKRSGKGLVDETDPKPIRAFLVHLRKDPKAILSDAPKAAA